MDDEANRHAPNETGGVLLGYWRDKEPVITHIVGPGPTAIHSSDAFVPDYAYHEAEIARIYAQTPWTVHYLGDWHTHPGMPAYMSKRDKRALRRIATYRQARVSKPVMLILGYGPQWEPRVWQGEMAGAIACCRRLISHSLELEVFDS